MRVSTSNESSLAPTMARICLIGLTVRGDTTRADQIAAQALFRRPDALAELARIWSTHEPFLRRRAVVLGIAPQHLHAGRRCFFAELLALKLAKSRT
jgi:hypothetical protein